MAECSLSTSLSSSTDVEEVQVVSLVDRLRAPQTSDLARKRKVGTNPSPKGNRTSRGATPSDPKGVSPAQRLKAYPEEPFVLSHGQLFCNSCREELSVKSSSLRNHVKSAKHQAGKQKLALKEAREREHNVRIIG